MRNGLYILYIGVVLLLVSCADNDITTGQGRDPESVDPVGQPVLFSAGNIADARTRALGSTSPYYYGMTNTSGVPYMAEGGRFVCTMYYHPAAGDTDASDFDIKDAADGGTMTTAWLKVNNNVGNSVYWNKAYTAVDESDLDEYGFDKASSMFYWQNRLTHAFLALADYNQLATNVGTTTNTKSDLGKLKMYPNSDIINVDKKLYANTYDLTRGKWEYVKKMNGDVPVLDDNNEPVWEWVYKENVRTKMSDQPDPILALTIMKPAGATQEANRVRLYFKHQFSQIQVNVKGADDNSADISADQIEKVELLGVSTEGYVCCRLNANGTVGPATAKDVNLDEFKDEELANNKWGTSFEMFDMATGVVEDGHDTGYAIGFLKSFNAIAFGQLWAIRITWHEGTTSNPGIVHVATFEVPQTNETSSGSSSSSSSSSEEQKPVVQLRNLQSGLKYVYNLELRRGTLAVIRTEILPWEQKPDLVYGTDGTITN